MSKGFTLVEMSIVLVIIALVAASVVVGKELITQAQNRKTLSELETIERAGAAFKLKYGFPPGDIPNPARFGFNASGGFGGTGNGNGLVDSYANLSYQAGEVILFWRHLKQANMLQTSVDENNTNGCFPVNGVMQDFSSFYPLATGLSTVYWIAWPGYNGGSEMFQGPTSGGSTDGNNYLLLDSTAYYHATCALNHHGVGSGGQYPATLAYYIDAKRDDGMPGSGYVSLQRSNMSSPHFNPPAYGATNCATSATQYNFTNHQPKSNQDSGCMLKIRVNY